MCLNIVDSKPRKYRRAVGWKVFEQSSRGLSGTIVHGPILQEGIWISEKGYRPPFFDGLGKTCLVGTDDGIEYAPGWHIFRYKYRARLWRGAGNVLRKVRYRDILATGQQLGRVIVARDIYIIPKGKKRAVV